MHLLTSTKIFIVDFEDSFTYNLASDLYCINSNLKVINHNVFFNEVIQKVINSKEKIVIVLGPGPGHPNEHIEYFDWINEILQSENIFCLGICLGHQIIAKILGYQIAQSKDIVHGESVTILLDEKEVRVQRYNSLAVLSEGREIEKSTLNNEVLVLKDKKYLTYQFHPESVGTAKSVSFYNEIFQHLGK